MISLEKLRILTPLQKLAKNVEDLGKILAALKSCSKSNKSPNLVTLLLRVSFSIKHFASPEFIWYSVPHFHKISAQTFKIFFIFLFLSNFLLLCFPSLYPYTLLCLLCPIFPIFFLLLLLLLLFVVSCKI